MRSNASSRRCNASTVGTVARWPKPRWMARIPGRWHVATGTHSRKPLDDWLARILGSLARWRPWPSGVGIPLENALEYLGRFDTLVHELEGNVAFARTV